jgi:hypothetical protein
MQIATARGATHNAAEHIVVALGKRLTLAARGQTAFNRLKQFPAD